MELGSIKTDVRRRKRVSKGTVYTATTRTRAAEWNGGSVSIKGLKNDWERARARPRVVVSRGLSQRSVAKVCRRRFFWSKIAARCVIKDKGKQQNCTQQNCTRSKVTRRKNK